MAVVAWPGLFYGPWLKTNLPSTAIAFFPSAGSRVLRCHHLQADRVRTLNTTRRAGVASTHRCCYCCCSGQHLRYRPASDTNKLSPNASSRRLQAEPIMRCYQRRFRIGWARAGCCEAGGCDQQTWFMRRPGVVQRKGKAPASACCWTDRAALYKRQILAATKASACSSLCWSNIAVLEQPECRYIRRGVQRRMLVAVNPHISRQPDAE